MKKFLRIFLTVLILGLVFFVYYRYYRDFGDGVKAGTLNYVVRKGYIFKTYEGELIQTGLQSKAPNALQSNEFSFSVENKAVAEKLELATGKEVQLHYTEYLGSIPGAGIVSLSSTALFRSSRGSRGVGFRRGGVALIFQPCDIFFLSGGQVVREVE
jgi:hypothetical protein